MQYQDRKRYLTLLFKLKLKDSCLENLPRRVLFVLVHLQNILKVTQSAEETLYNNQKIVKLFTGTQSTISRIPVLYMAKTQQTTCY